MTDTFEFTLNNPLTEEQWDMIEDVDFERTDRIWFHTKHGNEVEFTKVRHGKFIGTEFDGYADGCPVYYEWKCSECGCMFEEEEPTYNYCPNCGAKMDAEEDEE